MPKVEICPDGLDELDFDPDIHCEFYHRIDDDASRCGAPAKWMVIHGCCGRQTFMCDRHRTLGSDMSCRFCRICFAECGCRWVKL